MSPEFGAQNPNLVRGETDLRIISHPPTPQIQKLADINYGLYDEKNLLCPLSPSFFVGSLIIAANKSIFSDLLKSQNPQIPVNSELATPIEIHHQVPLVVHSTITGREEHPKLLASTVLVKKACGLYTGVVLEGPLTGLLLTKHTGSQFSQKMLVDRLWNNDQLDQNSLINTTFSLPVSKKYLRQYLQNETAVEDFYKKEDAIFSQLYQDVIQTFNGNTVYEFFLLMCQKLGIKVDTQNFHYTTAIPTL
ncbi:MAG: hypothetical protein Q8P53_01005 [Candidatus Shapirobacteria bacterium]|nr:hypothetical protein [Candidatus Shapirobacteria bacterium]